MREKENARRKHSLLFELFCSSVQVYPRSNKSFKVLCMIYLGNVSNPEHKTRPNVHLKTSLCYP